MWEVGASRRQSRSSKDVLRSDLGVFVGCPFGSWTYQSFLIPIHFPILNSKKISNPSWILKKSQHRYCLSNLLRRLVTSQYFMHLHVETPKGFLWIHSCRFFLGWTWLLHALTTSCCQCCERCRCADGRGHAGQILIWVSEREVTQRNMSMQIQRHVCNMYMYVVDIYTN